MSSEPGAVQKAAEAYAEEGDRALIERAVVRLLKVSEGFSNPYYRFYAANECAMVQALAGNRDLSSKNFSRAKELAQLGGDRLAKVAAHMGKAGFYDRALDVIRSISGIAEKEQALANLASARAEAGEYAQAIRICDMVQTYHRFSDPVLLKIVKYQLTQGKVEDSLDTCNHISHLAHKGEAMLMVATAQANTGDRKQALKTARSVDFVKVDENSAFQEGGPSRFDISRPETWAFDIDRGFPGTMASFSRRAMAVANLAAAALRFQETAKLIESPDYAKAFQGEGSCVLEATAAAHVEMGKVDDVLNWVERLHEADQVWAMLGVAEGLLRRAKSKERKQEEK